MGPSCAVTLARVTFEGIYSNFSVWYEAEVKMLTVQMAADIGSLQVQLEYS